VSAVGESMFIIYFAVNVTWSKKFKSQNLNFKAAGIQFTSGAKKCEA
jgi:hypothetical protein